MAFRHPRKIDTTGADLDDTLGKKRAPISAVQGLGGVLFYARVGQGSSNPALLYRAWEFFQDSPLPVRGASMIKTPLAPWRGR
jgi:hypothetical protein